jgi:Cu-Zn family superoxide dismutase
MPRLALFALLLLFAACTTEDQTQLEDNPHVREADPSADMYEAPTPVTGVAIIEPLSGSDVSGQVTFTRVMTNENYRGTVRVRANIDGLEPGTLHGFHIHEFGSCADDGQAAGGHFAPYGSPHGGPNDLGPNRHVGDMGNLVANDDGRATYNEILPEIAITPGDTASVVGLAVIVHAQEDDLTSQPSGAAGPRIGCGIIEIVESTNDRGVDVEL